MTSGDLSAELEIPHYSLSKTLQKLVRHGILRSSTGLYGGFELAKPADEITLYDVEMAIEGNADLHQCFLGIDHCCEESPCPAYPKFAPVREAYLDFLKGTTLSDL